MLKIPQVEELSFCLQFWQNGPSVSLNHFPLRKYDIKAPASTLAQKAKKISLSET